jgi:thiamine biosynthesis lipoprotein
VAAERTAEISFRAMGTDVQVLVVDGPAGAAARARAQIEDMERRWSRFLARSELSRLNGAAGAPVVVSLDTAALVDLAVQAWRATAGAFDPTVLRALESWGYDRSFERIDRAASGPPTRPEPAPGCDGVLADASSGLVLVPLGVALDLGGIGKGRAADVVADAVLAEGADGVCVNVGGDLRVGGEAPDGERWWIAVADELAPDDSLGRIEIADGGVATSTPHRRTWTRGERDVHHLIDPRTGQPAESGLASVTVHARTAAWAEVLAKAAYVAGAAEGIELLRDLGGEGLFLTDDGDVLLTPAFAAACA